MKAVFTILVMLLAACSVDGGGTEVPSKRFTSRPVVLHVSAALPDECAEAVLDDVLWYRERGVTMAAISVEPDAPSQLGIPVGGVVAVHEGVPTKPEAGGETLRALTIGGDIFYADVLLRKGRCEPRLIAHELGHALGLVDLYPPGNLMSELYVEGNWELTDKQLAWIKD